MFLGWKFGILYSKVTFLSLKLSKGKPLSTNEKNSLFHLLTIFRQSTSCHFKVKNKDF